LRLLLCPFLVEEIYNVESISVVPLQVVLEGVDAVLDA